MALRAALVWHRRLGLALALPLLLIALTGMVLGFYDALRYRAPPYRVAAVSAPALAPEQLAQRLKTLYPELALTRLTLPTVPGRSVRARLEGGQALTVFLQPATGAVVAVRDSAKRDWLDSLYAWHRGKGLGLPGQLLASACGLGIALLWLLGLGSRRSRRGYPWSGASAGARLSSLHRGLGLFLASPLVLLALAGALLNFAGPLQRWLTPPPVLAPAEPALPLARIRRIAEWAHPDAALERIHFPTGEGLFRLRFDDGTWISIAAASGRVIEIRSSDSHWLNWLYPLHSGRLFGPYGPPLIAGSGAVLAVVLVSGLVLDGRRRWQARRRQAK